MRYLRDDYLKYAYRSWNFAGSWMRMAAMLPMTATRIIYPNRILLLNETTILPLFTIVIIIKASDHRR